MDQIGPQYICGYISDLDHIMGSTEFFELLHAAKYQGDGRIKIRELWVPAAMLIEEAARDEHFQARGLFARKVTVGGRAIPALPVPLAPELRGTDRAASPPALGEANDLLTSV